MLLGSQGYEAASAATPTSFFTAPFLSQAIWRLATRLGFCGGAVLEPGCGTGQVLAHAPADLDIQVTGIEQEPLTASIASLLHPQAHIINAPLQEVALAEDAFDLVVGNVPFADIPIFDRTLPFKKRLSLHNYCLYRALAALRPGGLAILITSRYTLDAMHSEARAILGDLGIFLGAIRLPGSSHRFAKTAVITDLVVLQRRHSRSVWKGHDWLGVVNHAFGDVEMETNTYFAQHPEHILGTVTLGRGMYHDQELIIRAPDDLEAALAQASDRITTEAIGQRSLFLPRFDARALDHPLVQLQSDGREEGCFYLLPEKGLVQICEGQPKAITRTSLLPELTALVHLRDAALALVEAERDYERSDEDLLPLRRELGRRYDAYVAQYGFLNRSTVYKRIDKETGEEHLYRRLPPAMSVFRTDAHAPLLLSLERYDEERQQAEKAPILTQRVNVPPIYKERADSREEAIALSLDRYGRLDFPFIARLTGRPVEQIAEYLGELVYEDPERQEWEIAPLYLSGNVRHKLEVARKAAQADPQRWQRNIEALEPVQPAPIPPEQITVLLGAPWLPEADLIQFCRETFKFTPEIHHERLTGKWTVVPPRGVGDAVQIKSIWGTRRVSAFRLLEHLLNHRTTIVMDIDEEGKQHFNAQETMLAQQKRKEIQARFRTWIWEEQARTERLAALYNTLYNGTIPTSYSGAHLSFPGMDPYWQAHLYPWQRDFIARMLTNRSALCAYPVGAGKTKIQVAGAMTLRRMGLISKAAILVPNHLLEQIAAEAKQLYPGANILMLSREDLGQEHRRLFLARIATGTYDLIVMTHSAFQAIDVHPSTRAAYIREQIREYKQVLSRIPPESEDRAEQRQIKQIEKQIQRLHERLKALLAIPHDPGITFEQLGISYIIVDEAHFFKNLGLPTNQEKLQAQPSQRAHDLLMKLRWLEQQNGTRPFASFFTATPISNSMVEAFVMLWYLNQRVLTERQLATIDDFASVFIESEAAIEVTPNGADFRLYERPRRFVNLPEFLHLFTTVADIRPPDILAEQRPDRLEHTIAVEPTEEVIAFVNGLVERTERLHEGDPMTMDNGKLDNMLWVTGDGRKAALWLGLHRKPEQYPAKLDAIATQMATVYHRWQEQAAYLPGPYKSLQIGFCDLGTPSAEKGEQVYGELKRLLVEKGIPAAGIRYIHEVSDSDTAKAALFEQCRNGQVAILLGSTAKLGTGTNIQTRCAAIHHCDAPWRPDEVEQREGRGQRPGNLYPVVEIFYYVQRRTFDAYSWQILSNKAKFFNQLRSCTITSREMAYSDDSSLTYGQVKAAATGDVLLLEHANVTLSAEAFTQLHASYERARDRDRQQAEILRQQARYEEKQFTRLQQIAQVRASYTGAHPWMTPERLLMTSKEQRRAALAERVLEAIKKQAYSSKLGEWQGVPIFLRIEFLAVHTATYTLMAGDAWEGESLSFSPGWLEKENLWRIDARIEEFFLKLDLQMEELRASIQKKLQQAEEFEQQAQVPFPQEQDWQAVLARKRELDHYIEQAARARSEQALRKLAQLRERLLATVPQDLVERPRARSSAQFVLPPRDPNAQTVVEQKHIEVAEVEAKEQTIEQVARTIQQSVVGSKATLVFGNLEPLKKMRREKKGKKHKTSSKETKAAASSIKQASAEAKRKTPSTALPTLWDALPEEPLPPPSPEPAAHIQMSLW
jgi:N12 class adenine-specific DNA methylase/SAM-dependent methyltransferase